MSSSPRSYVIETNSGSIRRNRRDLIPTKGPLPIKLEDEEVTPKECIPDNTQGEPSGLEKAVNLQQASNGPSEEVRTRSGRLSKPPQRLDL